MKTFNPRQQQLIYAIRMRCSSPRFGFCPFRTVSPVWGSAEMPVGRYIIYVTYISDIYV